MKCPDCGNINVETKEVSEKETTYYCEPCEKGFSYSPGNED
ncbi:hypothetical protein [Bacillus atrophaeus]|nr:hypothetical protein [Bacillus atrophaeus]